MSSLLTQLQEASQGLWYISETDAALEPIALPAGASAHTPEAFLQAIGSTGQSVETVTLAHFFRNMVRPDVNGQEAAEKFKALQGFLEANLKEERVYRVGEVQVQAYVLGQAPDGTWQGLKTHLVET